MRAAVLCICLAACGAVPIPLTPEQIKVRAAKAAEKQKRLKENLNRMRWEVRAQKDRDRLARAPITARERDADALRTLRAQRFRRVPHAPLEIDLNDREKRTSMRMLYVDRGHKFAFCAIPKVACTEFLRLVYRMVGNRLWWRDPHFRSDAPTLARVSDTQEAMGILNDPNWTKAVFLRDPATRLLSAYLDKFVESPARGVHGDYGLRHFNRTLNWTQFVDAIASDNKDRSKPEGLHLGTNAHWKPQRFHCSLEKFLPVYSFVGRYEDLRAHAEALLRSLNLWDEFGSNGWGHRTRRERLYPKADDAPPLRDALFQSPAKHHTGAAKRKDEFLTPAIMAKVRQAYAQDYEILDSLGLREDGDPTSGFAWAPARRALCDVAVRAQDRRTYGAYCEGGG